MRSRGAALNLRAETRFDEVLLRSSVGLPEVASVRDKRRTRNLDPGKSKQVLALQQPRNALTSADVSCADAE